jgi:hypothetical protein
MALRNGPAGDGGEFRQYLPDLSSPRFQAMQKQDAHAYAEAFKTSGNPPWLHGLYLHWRKLFQERFKGITNDGRRHRAHLFRACVTHRLTRQNIRHREAWALRAAG